MASFARIWWLWCGLVVVAGCGGGSLGHGPAAADGPAVSSAARRAAAGSVRRTLRPPQVAGSLYTWGDNDAGQLGVGTISDPGNHFDQDAATPEPAHLPPGTQVVSMAGGLSDTIVATTSGAVYATGYNKYGQLGDGNFTAVTAPVPTLLPRGVTVTAVSMGHDQALALTSSGLLYAWGWNAYGQAGAGLKQHNIDVPVAVKLPNGITVTAIGTGSNHDLAVTSAGGLLTWGLNADGQLGNGSFTNSSVPVSIALPNGDAAVAACGGYDHSLVLGASGSVYAWGLNNHGQLGDGTEVQSSVPVTVQMPPGIMVAAVAAGEDYSLAMDTNGNVYAWGFGGDDDLGNGSQLDSTTPVSVDVPPGVVPVAIAAGGNRAHLLSAAGQIYDWGSGENGKHTDPVPTLDKVPPGETPVAIGDGPEAEQYLAEMVP